MHFSVLFYLTVFYVITQTQTQTTPFSTCKSAPFEPCVADCLITVVQLNSSVYMLFYTRYYIELDLDRLSIRMDKHLPFNEQLLEDKRPCRSYTLSNTMHLYCNRELFNATEQSLKFVRSARQMSKEIQLRIEFFFSLPNRLVIFTNESLYAVCDSLVSPKFVKPKTERAYFLSTYHLKEIKSAFLTADRIVLFTSNYLLYLKASQLDRINSSQADDDIVQPLLDQLHNDRRSVKKIYFKDLFGCSQNVPSTYLPFNRNLIEYHRIGERKRNLFISAITCYGTLFLFLTSAIIVVRLLNSRLVHLIEHSFTKDQLSDKERLFVRLRAEIENGVRRKLEQTETKDLVRTNIQVLVDTLLYEQIYVNSPNLDALKSIDLVRHLINEVVETVKNHVSDRSTEKAFENENQNTLDRVLSSSQHRRMKPSKLLTTKLASNISGGQSMPRRASIKTPDNASARRSSKLDAKMDRRKDEQIADENGRQKINKDKNPKVD